VLSWVFYSNIRKQINQKKFLRVPFVFNRPGTSIGHFLKGLGSWPDHELAKKASVVRLS
jgi:hypothetical protein